MSVADVKGECNCLCHGAYKLDKTEIGKQAYLVNIAHVFCFICNLNKLVRRNCLLQVRRGGTGTCPCMLQCAVNNTEGRQLTFLLCLAYSDL